MRRCPSCGAELDSAPLPDLPRGIAASEELQEPAFPRDPRARRDDTAPLSEFLAAGAVLGGLVMIVLGAVVQSGTVALVGVVMMFGVTGFFAIFKGSLGRALTHYRTTMWGGFRHQYHEKPEYDREQDKR
jgi:hypothetical protein